MKNNHYLLRTMKKQKQNQEEKKNPKKLQSDRLLSEFAAKLLNFSNSGIEENYLKYDRRASYHPIDLKTAKERLHKNRINIWKKSRK